MNIKQLLILIILSFGILYACSNNDSTDLSSISVIKDSNAELSSEASDTTTASNDFTTYQSIVEILPNCDDLPPEIASVFYDGKPFIYVYPVVPYDYSVQSLYSSSKELCINDFIYEAFAVKTKEGNIELEEYNIRWERYAVLDFDRDGINELIYYVYQGGNGFFIIFHVINGSVYGYSETYRNIDLLFKDGTIVGEAGASTYWYERIESFDLTGFTTSIFASHENDCYTICGEVVSEKEFSDYTKEWNYENMEAMVEWVSASK